MNREEVFSIARNLVEQELNEFFKNINFTININSGDRKIENVIAKKMVIILVLKYNIEVSFTYQSLGKLLNMHHSNVMHHAKYTNFEIQYPDYVNIFEKIILKFSTRITNNTTAIQFLLKKRNKINQEIIDLLNLTREQRNKVK